MIKKKKVFKKNMPFLIVINRLIHINLNFLRILINLIIIIKNYLLLLIIILNFQTLFLRNNNKRIFKMHKKIKIRNKLNNHSNKFKIINYRITFLHFIKMIL